MYRQPENSNRVKSMKSRFEGLNEPNAENNDKSKKSPIRTVSPKSVNINGKIINDKQKQKVENNNNDYKSILECKKNTLSKEAYNLKIDHNKMKTDDGKSRKEKYGDKNSVVKDFSDVNIKELCNVPPLNLTRQLNDPSKKGCIKRTPAFRKDKTVNSRSKTSEDLNFANIVKLFESNNDNNEPCDNLEDNTTHQILTSNSDNNRRSDIKVSFTAKQSLNSTVSLTDMPKIVQKQKLSTSLANVASEKINKNAMQKLTEVQKQKLTTSTSLILDSKTTKSNLISQFRQKSLSPSRVQNPVVQPTNITLKISEKENRFTPDSVPLVKEIIQTLSNNEHKSLIDETKTTENTGTIIPAYAQVVKPKKKELPGGNDLGLTDTLKAALKQPLPSGPPPKKPPRTFAHTPNSKSSNSQENESVIDTAFCDRLNENLAQGLSSKSTPESEKKPIKIKSDPKLMLQKLENALLSNKIRSPKLPKKLKSFDSPKSQNLPSSTQPNLYTVESSQKNLFPNCLPSLNCVSKTSASNTYAKIAPKVGTLSMSTFFTESKGKSNEPIYAEPYEFRSKENSPKPSRIGFFRSNSHDGKADTLSNSLHYMSNPVGEWKRIQTAVQTSEESVTVKQQNSECSKHETNGGESESGPLTRHKLNLIMNHTYATPSPSDSDMDSLPSTPSSDGTPQSSKRNTIKELILSFEQKQQQLEPTSLNIPATIKHKLTVSSSWPTVIHDETDTSGKQVKESDLTVEEKKKYKSQLNRTLTEIRKTYVKRVCSTLKRKSSVKEEVTHLFECCLLVGLNVSDLTPYIKNKYPPNFDVPPWVEHLCFPDATEWSEKLSSSNIRSQDCQCYSLVITDEKGDRKYGYCRRVVPEEASVCLPLTYCIISSYRAAGFYHKVLQEMESRHGLPFGLQEAFVKELYNCKFPQPGESVKISCLLRSLVVSSCAEMVKNQQITSPENVECVKRLVNMQNGVYGCLNKTNNRKSDNFSEEWSLVEESDFRTPKNTYGSKNDSEASSFAKITKYSKEFRRCNSVNNSNDSLDSIGTIEILRPKENHSFIHQNQNTRSSEPQINKRFGQLFEDIKLSDNKIKDTETSDSQTNSLKITSESDVGVCNSPLLHLPNSQLLHDCLLGDVVLKRPLDSRLEDADLITLFNTLDLVTLLQTFGSLLHERKVIFVSSCLSKLSSCIEALQSILYPFSWQHTFIPVLSSNMLDILSAPLPLIAGVLAAHITETLIIEEGIAVNLDTSTVVCYMGDESDIIPKRLQKGLTTSLQLVTEATETDDRSKNVFVSDAFIRMFVEVCGCYKQFIVVNEAGQKVFEREAFIKDHSSKSKCIRWFLEWFSETAMFNQFIQSYIDGESSESIFEQKCIELSSLIAMQKSLKVAQKVKNFSHKIFH